MLQWLGTTIHHFQMASKFKNKEKEFQEREQIQYQQNYKITPDSG